MTRRKGQPFTEQWETGYPCVIRVTHEMMGVGPGWAVGEKAAEDVTRTCSHLWVGLPTLVWRDLGGGLTGRSWLRALPAGSTGTMNRHLASIRGLRLVEVIRV